MASQASPDPDKGGGVSFSAELFSPPPSSPLPPFPASLGGLGRVVVEAGGMGAAITIRRVRTRPSKGGPQYKNETPRVP